MNELQVINGLNEQIAVGSKREEVLEALEVSTAIS
jgi:hypothetical protein